LRPRRLVPSSYFLLASSSHPFLYLNYSSIPSNEEDCPSSTTATIMSIQSDDYPGLFPLLGVVDQFPPGIVTNYACWPSWHGGNWTAVKIQSDEQVSLPQFECESRGNYEILLSCLITLVLCSWTALHLNVPEYGTSRLKKFGQKLMWLGVSVLAPEFVNLPNFESRKDF
jgi:hypothetical protein